MAVNTTVDIKNLRGLSKLVSHAAFKKLSAGTNQSAYIRRMKKYLGWRKAISITQYLDIRTMMGSLRKPEYLKLVKMLAGFIPEATPVFLYKACLETLQCFTPEEVQGAYHSVLKERISVANNQFIQEEIFPCYLNFSIYNQKLHKNSYLTLVNNLNKTI